MSSFLKSTKNTRAILKDSYKWVRSDVPNNLTEQEIQWLIENNIVTVVDLREESERKTKVCQLIHHEDFTYHCLPVTGGNVVPPTTDDVPKSYIKMVDERMKEIIDTILGAKTNVLYFCNAGKDRTGVVSAILLKKAGASREEIIDDYMQSKGNLKEMIDAYAAAFPGINKDVITPHERYMEEFLGWLEASGEM